jgi:hypothetical protein
LHFDVVAVSGANEYRVKPLALVTTVTPLTCAVFSAPPAAAALDPEAGALAAEAGALDAEAGALDDAPPAAVPLDDELEHAAALIATAAVPAAASIVTWILMGVSFTGSCLFRHEPPEPRGLPRPPAWRPARRGRAPRGGDVRRGPAESRGPAQAPGRTAARPGSHAMG